MNTPLNRISGFLRQASSVSRLNIERGYSTGKAMLGHSATMRQIGMRAALGAGIGAASGAGYSAAMDDRRIGRDMVRGGLAGGLVGAGWGAAGPAKAAWKDSRAFGVNAMHGPREGGGRSVPVAGRIWRDERDGIAGF